MIYHKYIGKYEQKYLCCCCYNQCFGLCKSKKENSGQTNTTDIEMGTDLKMTKKDTDESSGDDNETVPPLTRTRSVEEQAVEYRAIGMLESILISLMDIIYVCVFVCPY